MTAVQVCSEIDRPYPVTAQQAAFFRERGYIKVKEVLPADVLARYGEEITRKVRELNTQQLPMEKRDTYQKAFLQVMNLWTRSEVVKTFVFGRRLARLAAELMGVSGVRMYHDQALYKEAGGGITPWHADQYYWPLDTPNTCTAWIPLQAVPLEMGPLAFASGTHHFKFGRDLAISDESERELARVLRERDFPLVEEPFELGEVSFHYGWTFHRAGANSSQEARRVMTVIYMDADARLAKPRNKNQEADWAQWCPGATIGQVVDTPLNPVLWRKGT